MRRILSQLKRLATAAAARVANRHLIWLPLEARSEAEIFDAAARYRVEDHRIVVQLRDLATGRLHLVFSGYESGRPTATVWEGEVDYTGPATLSVDVECGTALFGERQIGTFGPPKSGRRFLLRFRLRTDQGEKRRRTAHYFPTLSEEHGEEYFKSGNYVDYDAQSRGEVDSVLQWLERAAAKGPLLEVGCATGVVLAGLKHHGWDVYGVDVSEWAVNEASKRLPGRVACCNVESDPMPSTFPKQFETLLLWNVLEHFHKPFEILAKLTRYAAPNARLLIATCNADGIGKLIHGAEWEGYSDPTHHGVDAVGARSLREKLPALGWRIERLETERVWDLCEDPLHVTLRDWWTNDARCRQLLAERDMGDLLRLHAVRG
jgi:2-polyprenyl-3-methyl-5-hydroxy-6-metoxy-1,4-benzoquinol methylase